MSLAISLFINLNLIKTKSTDYNLLCRALPAVMMNQGDLKVILLGVSGAELL